MESVEIGQIEQTKEGIVKDQNKKKGLTKGAKTRGRIGQFNIPQEELETGYVSQGIENDINFNDRFNLKRKNNNKKKIIKESILNKKNFQKKFNGYYVKPNVKPNVKRKWLDVSVENDQLRELAETNDVMDQADRMEKNYQPMMGGKEDLFANGFSKLEKEINGLKERINNINIGGYWSVDENKMINNPTLDKYVFVDKQSENFQDLVENSSNDKLRELFEKAKKKKLSKKKEEEEKEKSAEDPSSNETSSLENESNESSSAEINNNNPSIDKYKLNTDVESKKIF